MRRKRLLSLLLTLCMVITLLPVSVFAVETEIMRSGEWAVGLSDLDHSVILVTDYTGTAEEVTIPQKIGGFVPDGISQFAFHGNTTMKVLHVPEGLFINGLGSCSVESVHLGENVVLNSSAFAGCRSLKNVTFPTTLTELPDKLFQYCESLETINLPTSVTKLGYNVFEGCNSLKEFTFPDSVKSMKDNVFLDCTGLVTVDMGSGMEKIGNWIFKNCTSLETVDLGNITTSGMGIFENCSSLKNVDLGQITCIDTGMFKNCSSLSSVVIPGTVTTIGMEAFSGCANLTEVRFKGDAPSEYITMDAFSGVTATVYYPAGNETWTQDMMLDYGGTLTWVPYDHFFQVQEVVEPTCLEQGYTTYVCADCGHSYQGDIADPLGHEFEEWVITKEPICDQYGEREQKCTRCGYAVQEPIYETPGHRWNDENAAVKTCLDCGKIEGGYRINLFEQEFDGPSSMWIDGKEYPVIWDDTGRHLELERTDATNLVAYTYNDPYATDIHTQYPTGMKVWMLSFADGVYTATYVKEFDDLLQYSGSSIRITGTKGIRMITSIDKTTKKALTGKGLAGYTLEEYGTALAWASDLEGGNPLVLGQSYTKSNFAYKKGKADPVFKDTGKLVQYTNVLVGFNDDQCIPDIAMRPYIILKDANGKQITIYGGIVYRSIGYIAYQNRSAFKAGTSSYKYVWGIIHHVYGNQFDSDYKG